MGGRCRGRRSGQWCGGVVDPEGLFNGLECLARRQYPVQWGVHGAVALGRFPGSSAGA